VVTGVRSVDHVDLAADPLGDDADVAVARVRPEQPKAVGAEATGDLLGVAEDSVAGQGELLLPDAYRVS
jgi:hypothetical protein